MSLWKPAWSIGALIDFLMITGQLAYSAGGLAHPQHSDIDWALPLFTPACRLCQNLLPPPRQRTQTRKVSETGWSFSLFSVPSPLILLLGLSSGSTSPALSESEGNPYQKIIQIHSSRWHIDRVPVWAEAFLCSRPHTFPLGRPLTPLGANVDVDFLFTQFSLFQFSFLA